ncbi:MAG: FAD:protein FMN transferase, partial [Candidatus Dormibacteria bacterium]
MTALADGRALGTSLRVAVAELACLEVARVAVDSALEAVDRACSRFREDGELARVHAAGGRETNISPLLASAIKAALHGARSSGGAVDPTVGNAVIAAGYDGDFDGVVRDGPAADGQPLRVPGWRLIQLDDVRGTLRLPPGITMDLGSTAKALAADLAARAAFRAVGCGVLVNLGGDMAVAGEPPQGGWRILVAEDSGAAEDDPGEHEVIAIRSGGVATSSTTVRRWRRGGVELHHIIDPRSGRPARGPWRTVTVVAATCLDANIAATAAIVRGEPARAWLQSRALPARLVERSGRIHRTTGWPARDPAPGPELLSRRERR